ncbi:hypothetical protein Forpe1208_v015789 [Fusarium oxysporum f. sp. rapae]|uniref:Uncharacterized protein n=1 Tax=Fusarium oxysporum f. sp. rapae TaxID=485398 RepID=A0A8J5NHG8_FUSOX|nr:hypothetical protein Forpe1208_v015789 [Fusarium oxysporum f. sp. rapae]
MSSEEPSNPWRTENDGGRPDIKPSEKKPDFSVGDRVNILLADGSVDPDGPFLVSRVVSADQCTLCDRVTYAKAKEGAVFSMAALESAA